MYDFYCKLWGKAAERGVTFGRSADEISILEMRCGVNASLVPTPAQSRHHQRSSTSRGPVRGMWSRSSQPQPRSPPRSLGRRSAAARPICRGRERASARCDGRSSSSGEGSTPLARRRPEKVRHRTPAPRTSGGEGERGEDKVREFSFYGKTEDLFFQPTRARARGTGSLHLAHNIRASRCIWRAIVYIWSMPSWNMLQMIGLV